MHSSHKIDIRDEQNRHRIAPFITSSYMILSLSKETVGLVTQLKLYDIIDLRHGLRSFKQFILILLPLSLV